MASEAELADLFITLRAVNAPMLAGFTQVSMAGEEMTAALNASFGEIDATIARAAESLAALRSEMASVASGAAEVGAGSMASTTALEGAGVATATGAATAATPTAETIAERDAMAKMAAEEAQLQAQIDAGYDQIAAKFAEISAAANATAATWNEDFAKMAADTIALSDAMDAAQVRVDAANADMAAATEAAAAKQKEATTGAIAGVGIAGALVAGATVKMAADFQTATTRLVTSAGETQSNLKLVGDGMLAMAGQVGLSANQLATGMYTVESAGYHGADGLTVLKAAAQGAKNEGADLTVVADAVSTALNDYHLPASAAATVTSQLITAVGQGKTTMQDFSGALHSITPLASSMQISLADVTGTLAEMTSHGMSADQASQNLAETLRTLQKPSSQATAALAQIGMTVNGLQDSLSKQGLQGTLESISQAILEKMGPSGKVMLDAFNTSKQAAQNLTEALRVAPPALQQLGNAMVNGSMTVAQYRTAIKTLPVDQQGLATGFLSLIQQSQGFTNTLKAGGPQALTYNQMLQAVTGNATTMNTALMVTGENSAAAANNIRLVAGATADANGNVRGWSDTQGTFNQKMAEAKAGLGALATAIGEKLLPVVSAIAGALATAATWLAAHKSVAAALAGVIGGLLVGALYAAVAATWAWVAAGLAMDATPIGLVITGIALAIGALIGLVVLIVDHWKNIVGFFTDIWNAVKHAFETAINWVVNIFKGWYPLILGILSGGVLLIPALIMKYWSNIVSFFSGLWRNVTHAFSVGIQAALTFVKNLPHEIGYALGFLAGLLVRLAIDGWKHFTEGIKTAWKDTVKFFEDLPKNIAGFFSDVGHWLLDTGVKLQKGLYDGIAKGAEAVWNWFTHLPQEISGFFSDVGHWLMTSGVKMQQGLYDGIDNGAKAVWHWFTDTLPHSIAGFFSDVGKWLWNAGKDLIQGLLNGIGSMLSSVGHAISSFASGVVSGFKNALGINSPSKYTREHGQGLVEGLIAGMQDHTHLAVAAAQTLAGRVVAGMSGMSANATFGVTAGGISLGGAPMVSPAGFGGGTGAVNVVHVNMPINGSVVTDKDLARYVQRLMLQLQSRNGSFSTNVAFS